METTLPSLRRAFAVLSVLLLLTLTAAWAKDHFTEWRTIQQRYNALAASQGKPSLPVGIRQIWKPELDVVDRCVTCHVTMGGAATLTGDPLFAAHPKTPHAPGEFGCTACHGGQGRATTTAAAHGPTSDSLQPLLDAAHVQAGCGTCHTGLKTPAPPLAERGEQLFKDYECAGCHGEAAPLDTVGVRGVAEDWHDRHAGLISPAGLAFAPLADEDVPAVTAALSTRVGAPRLMAGKRLVAKWGCRGCHLINGVGADRDDGPSLDELPLRGELATSALAAWQRDHLLDPARLVKNSRMPRLGLSAEEADLITVYLLSLRARSLPEGRLPLDRVRTAGLGERDFAADGASLFAVFCSACHGTAGEGRTFDVSPKAFPALSNPDFLALADDEFLRRTIRLGRPGRRMPSWGQHLSAKELELLVGLLRSFEKPAPVFTASATPPELDLGSRLFADTCAPCHGPRGEGSGLAPPLAAKDNEVTATEERIFGTLAAGVAGTAMGSFRSLEPSQLRAISAAVRALPRLELSRATWKLGLGDPERGGALYREHCARCHEPEKGQLESKGPGILSPAFLGVAGDGYLAGTIIRGRTGREMPAFGSAGPEHARLDPQQVLHLVAFLRSRAPAARPP